MTLQALFSLSQIIMSGRLCGILVNVGTFLSHQISVLPTFRVFGGIPRVFSSLLPHSIVPQPGDVFLLQSGCAWSEGINYY